MITSLIATILGMVGGLLPDIIKEVRDTRNASREIELLRVQAQLQLEAAKATADGKLREVEAGIYAEEMKATREYLKDLWESQAKPVGIAWIDGFNAVLRPICVSLIMVLFMVTAVPFVWAIIGQYHAHTIDGAEMARVIWSSLVGESIMAVLGYLFGYRAAAKMPGAKP